MQLILATHKMIEGLKTLGDTWRTVYKEFPHYQVNPFGVVRSTYKNRNHIKNQRIYRKSYYRTSFIHKSVFKTVWIHRMVGKAFVLNPRPDLFDTIDHIDRDTMNNFYKNIRWVNRHLNSLNKRTYRGVSMVGGWYNIFLTFCGVNHYCGRTKSATEVVDVKDKIREELFNKLYMYLTQPVTWSKPETWKINKEGVTTI